MTEIKMIHVEIAKAAHNLVRKSSIKCTATPESVAIAFAEMKGYYEETESEQRKVACNA